MRRLLLLISVTLGILGLAVLGQSEAVFQNGQVWAVLAQSSPEVTSRSSTPSVATSTPGTTTTAPPASPVSTPTPLPSAPIPATSDQRQALSSGNAIDLATIATAAVADDTLLVNRTSLSVTFFLDGQTYRIPAGASLALALRRPSTVLSLFSCDAAQAVITGDNRSGPADCYWDPYLVRLKGYFEIIDRSDGRPPVSLSLQEVAPSAPGQIRLRNRSGHAEPVYYGDAVYTLAPEAVIELELMEGGPPLYARHCLASGARSVCEWLPYPVQDGAYYELSLVATRAGADAVTVVRTDLLPVQSGGETPGSTAGGGEPVAAGLAPANQTRTSCQLNVPILNVRSGPGTEYLILIKLSQGSDDPVEVLGRNAAGTWLAVSQEIQRGGWISGESTFVLCAGNIEELPVVPVSDGRLEATPVPQVVREAPPASAPAEPQAPTATPVSAPPADRARLIIVNAFGQELIFTLVDQYILQPGDQVVVDVDPGRITFSASSPWRALSANAEITVNGGETRQLDVRFEPTENPEKWNLAF